MRKQLSPESRERYRLAALKRSQDPAYIRKMSEVVRRSLRNPSAAVLAGREQMRASIKALYAAGFPGRKGIAHTAATRRKLSEAMRRRVAEPGYVSPATRPEVRAKISAVQHAHPHPHSPEVLRRIGIKIREKYRRGEMIPPMHHPGAAEKLSAYWRGKVKPPEQRVKISVSVKRAYREDRLISGWKIAAKTSPGERLLWPMLRRLGFRRGVVFPTGTRTRYQPDFTHMARKVIVEVDGSSHDHPTRMRTDAQREQYITGMGFLIQHFSERTVIENAAAVIQHVQSSLISKHGTLS